MRSYFERQHGHRQKFLEDRVFPPSKLYPAAQTAKNFLYRITKDLLKIFPKAETSGHVTHDWVKRPRGIVLYCLL